MLSIKKGGAISPFFQAYNNFERVLILRINQTAYQFLKRVEDERIKTTCDHQYSFYIKKGYMMNPFTGDKEYSSEEQFRVFIIFEENVYQLEPGEGGKRILYNAIATISKIEADRFGGVSIGDMIIIPDDLDNPDPQHQYIIENIEENKNDMDSRSSRVISYKLILRRSSDLLPEGEL